MQALTQIDISIEEFNLFKEYIYDNIGISLSEQKITLLRTRLNKRLRELCFTSFTEYYEHIKITPDEHAVLISAISTNVTYFFREKSHWKFLDKNLDKIIKNTKKLRIWSSACSTGEEPYSIGMYLKEYFHSLLGYDIKILATDISHEAIGKAQKGQYIKEQIDDLPAHHISNNFTKNRDKSLFEINLELKKLVMFRTFNLVYGNYNIFKNSKFHIIFCRNVLIYFDEETKEKVANNLANQLEVGGYLFIGHSESLMAHKNLKYIAPSIYQKK